MSDVNAAHGDAANLPPLPEGLLCPGCGYDLRGLTSERCPECGFALAALRAGEAQIPWVHRARLGQFNAYWRTVWWSARWPERFALEVARPVSYRESQSFRWVTALHAYAVVLAVSIVWAVCDRVQGWSKGALLWWCLGATQIAALTLLAGLPGVASYFFHPRRLPVEQQNRAMALSYYAWAPLAWTPLALPFFVAGFVLVGYRRWELHGAALFMVAGPIVLFSMVMWERRVYELLRRAIHVGVAGSLARLALLNLFVLGLLLVVLLLLISAVYLWLVWDSLR